MTASAVNEAPDASRRSGALIRGLLVHAACASVAALIAVGPAVAADRPTPLLAADKPVAWWFVYKFNAATYRSDNDDAERACPFGGEPTDYSTAFGQRYAVASSARHSLRLAPGLVGVGDAAPVGATFGAIYNSNLSYVVWNDQFYRDPEMTGCTDSCSSPWGHSKGVIAWNQAGEGVVIQVTTPSWPGAGNSANPRPTNGNTLGCVHHNNLRAAQHFFALRLSKPDVKKVLGALANASVVTDVSNPQIVRNGGPADVRALVATLGRKSTSTTVTRVMLSSGVVLVSKPSRLHVPPWHMLSAMLQVPLRTATWWASPKIPTTTETTAIACWDESLGQPGAVEVATTGTWDGRSIGLTGGSGNDYNHAKIAVSLSSAHHYAVFADLNQQGVLNGDCGRSQNGRGGLFFVVDDGALANGIARLLSGDTTAVVQ